MARGRKLNKNEPRPPQRVEALLPRWARLTSFAPVVSAGRQVSSWAVASALASAGPDRPTGRYECRNGVSQTTVGYPFYLVPPATTLPLVGRCGSGCAPRVLFTFCHHCTSSCRHAHRPMGPSLPVPSGIVLWYNRLLDGGSAAAGYCTRERKQGLLPLQSGALDRSRFRVASQPVLKRPHHTGELARQAGAPQGRTAEVRQHQGSSERSPSLEMVLRE
jgi:hypothetical protein